MIAELRGLAEAGPFTPEDWVGSTVARFGSDGAGLSRLTDGRLLRDAIAERPQAYLGQAHVARFGADPQLLVKLLNPGQRIPVHAHPGREFARRHLGLAHGKTEAWIMVGTSAPRPLVYLGFRQAVTVERLHAWVRSQDSAAILDALNPIPVEPGDAILVPAGAPHAIGAGILLVELQEPADLSVLMEWRDLDVDGERDGHLGLGFEVALGCVDRTAFTPDRLESLRRGRAEENAGPVRPLFPAAAAPFFRAERIRPAGGEVRIECQYSILVVVDGRGRLQPSSGPPLELGRGDTILVPHGAGDCLLTGSIDCIRCMPPQAGA